MDNGTGISAWFALSLDAFYREDTVGAGRARDEVATTLQSLFKCRGRGPLLQPVTRCLGTNKT